MINTKAKILAMITLTTFCLAPDARAIELKVPGQLVGHCLEGNGSGQSTRTNYQGEDYFYFKCTVPVFTQADFARIQSSFPGVGFYQMGVSYPYKHFGGAAYLTGFVGSQYGDYAEQVGTLNLVINAQCVSYGERSCRLGQVESLARELGSFVDARVELRVVRSIPMSPTSVCIERGPGYPSGPDCLRSSPVDGASGTFCKVPGSYPGPSCLEYGSINPPYPPR